MLAYTQDQYHVSLTLSKQHEDWSSFSYYATDAAVAVEDDSNANAYAARAYWRPQESGTAMPEISVGYDISVWKDKQVTVLRKQVVTLSV